MDTNKLDQYIKDAEATAKQHSLDIVDVLTNWEQTVPDCKGIVEYYKNPSSFPNNGGIPPPSAIPAPPAASVPSPAATGRTISSYAKNLLSRLAESYKKTVDELSVSYWENHDAIGQGMDLQGKDLEEQAVLFVQASLHGEITGNQTADYTFVVFQMSEMFEATDTVEETVGLNQTVSKKVKTYRRSLQGMFTRTENDGSVTTHLGSCTAWNEAAARSMEILVPFQEYKGEFEGRPFNKYFDLSLNKAGIFTLIRQSSEKEIMGTMIQLARETGLVVTPNQLARPDYKLKRAKGQSLFVEGRIGKAFFQTQEKSKKQVGKITLTEPHFSTDEPKASFITFWDTKSQIYKYAEKSHVLVSCRASWNKEYGVNLVGRFILPIMALPGKSPSQPAMASGRGN